MQGSDLCSGTSKWSTQSHRRLFRVVGTAGYSEEPRVIKGPPGDVEVRSNDQSLRDPRLPFLFRYQRNFWWASATDTLLVSMSVSISLCLWLCPCPHHCICRCRCFCPHYCLCHCLCLHHCLCSCPLLQVHFSVYGFNSESGFCCCCLLHPYRFSNNSKISSCSSSSQRRQPGSKTRGRGFLNFIRRRHVAQNWGYRQLFYLRLLTAGSFLAIKRLLIDWLIDRNGF